MKKILAIIGLILAATCVILLDRTNTLSKENKRLKSNQTALIRQVDFYETENGQYAASVQALALTKAELEREREDLADQVASLNVKLKRVQSIAQTVTKTDVAASVPIRDTLVIRDTVMLKLPAIKWRDPWVTIDGIITPDSVVDLTIQSCDTLTQVVHRVPHKFWFIKWGCKAIRQEITSRNPHTRVVYTEYVELMKK